jgi:hypothetical protein
MGRSFTFRPSGVAVAAVLAVLVIAAMTALAMPQAWAANIISFDDNATACGGTVLCSTNGTTRYNGTLPFNVTTINSWFSG